MPKNFYYLGIAVFLFVMQLSGQSLVVAEELASELFLSASPAADAPYDSDIKDTVTTRSRYVTIDWPALEGKVSKDVDKSLVKGQVILNLFADDTINAKMNYIENNGQKKYTWFGSPMDSEKGQIILVIDGDTITGNIVTENAVYQIRPSHEGLHIIKEIDQSRFPDEEHPLNDYESFYLPQNDDLFAEDTATDDGGQIDVLVVYTDDVETAVGAGNISSLIQLAISESNASFVNSGVNPRFRLVGQAKVNYSENGIFCNSSSSYLDRLTNPSDGFIDNVHNLRNAYNADVVSLWVASGGACGCAWRLTDTAGSPDSGFSVVRYDCATGNYSFGHEIGHNMSLHHDRYVATGSLYNHGYGFVNVANRWRTVMAYNNQCSNSGTSCTRLPYWSNPNVQYGGKPMGVAIGQAQAAFNAKVLNDVALVISNYRDSSATLDIGLGTKRSNKWYLDYNSSGVWDSGDKVYAFGWASDQPVIGDWNGNGKASIGVKRGNKWYLDYNGNGAWNSGDKIYTFGWASDKPVIGDWNGNGKASIGVKRGSKWYLDYNGNGVWDSGDKVYTFGWASDQPLAGDWNGNGKANIGVKRGNKWSLDYNGNGVWDSGDKYYTFGLASDQPVVGDWNDNGMAAIGIKRGANWYLDYNGNGVWNNGDKIYTFGQASDQPVAGDW